MPLQVTTIRPPPRNLRAAQCRFERHRDETRRQDAQRICETDRGNGLHSHVLSGRHCQKIKRRRHTHELLFLRTPLLALAVVDQPVALAILMLLAVVLHLCREPVKRIDVRCASAQALCAHEKRHEPCRAMLARKADEE